MKNKEIQNYEIFFQAKDIKVMEYAFKQVIAKENKKEKENILKQIKKYKDLSKSKDKTKEKIKRKVKEKVKDAFLMERELLKTFGIECCDSIDGFKDFVFLNRFGKVHNNGTLNKALRRIVRDCNLSIMEKINRALMIFY